MFSSKSGVCFLLSNQTFAAFCRLMNGIWSKDWNPMSFCPFTHPLLDSRSHQTVSSRFTAMTGHHLANGCLTNPKTPAGTQAHFTFPSKVSLLFSIRAPGNRGEGGGGGSNWGQEHWEEEGWANRQTLKVTIHHFTSNIKDTSNYRVQLRGSDTGWGISSIWPCVHVNWNAGRVTTRRNKIKLGNDTH